MKCERCNSEWQSLKNNQFMFCPFCHAPLIEVYEEFYDLNSVLTYLVLNFGIEVLENKQNTMGFLEEFFQGGKREINFLNNMYESGLMSTLFRLKSAPVPIQKSATVQVVKQLMARYGTSRDWSEYIVGCVCKALGIAVNSNESIIEIKQSAERGNLSAQFKLAKCYLVGQGIEKNIEKYMCWLRSAADGNYTEAEYILGVEFYHGYICEKNIDMALNYLERAIKKDNIDAMCFVLAEIDSQEMSRFKKYEIVHYLINRKQKLSSEQLVQLSKYFENVDFQQALLFAKLSYDRDSKSAWQHYVELLQRQRTHESDAIALKVTKEVATDGNTTACLLLGRRYENQAKTENDMLMALYWYRMAAEAGNLDAQLRLAEIYEDGKISRRDIESASYWYKIAAYNGSAYAKDKVNYKSPKCILKTITLVFEDDSDLECKVLKAVDYNGMDYLIIEDPETKEKFPIRYIEDDTLEGFEIESVDEKIEQIIINKFGGVGE